MGKGGRRGGGVVVLHTLPDGMCRETGYSFPIEIMGQGIMNCIETLGQGIKIEEIVWDRVLRRRS